MQQTYKILKLKHTFFCQVFCASSNYSYGCTEMTFVNKYLRKREVVELPAIGSTRERERWLSYPQLVLLEREKRWLSYPQLGLLIVFENDRF